MSEREELQEVVEQVRGMDNAEQAVDFLEEWLTDYLRHIQCCGGLG